MNVKKVCILFLVMSFAVCAYSQSEPALPYPCYNNGNNNKNNMTITGNTTFTFSNLAAFEGSQSSNSISVTVKSSARYRLYIAGVMTSPAASSTNTPIPINTFTVAATNRGTAPSTITLSNSYLEVAQYGSSTNGRTHTLTITRKALDEFVQAPGTHVLTLHIRYCQY